MNPYQISHEQAEHEARAKIMWGDSPEEVIYFLRVNGFTEDDAWSFVNDVFKERLATIRGNGIKKIIFGSVLVVLPFIAYAASSAITAVMVRVVGVTAALGLWGLWMLVRGLMMLISPASEAGEVSDE